MNKLKKEMSSGGVVGAQLPLGYGERNEKIKEVLRLSNGGLNENDVKLYFSHVPEFHLNRVYKMLDDKEYNKVLDEINLHFENIIREKLRNRIKEVVRKKEGGGGYILYSPNTGKKHAPKKVGEFPTKLQARRAELSRFPPKDPQILNKRREELQKLIKDPKKAAEKEKQWMLGPEYTKKKKRKKSRRRRTKNETFEIIKNKLIKGLNESLFKEEKKQNDDWDDYISKLSKQAVMADKKFQKLQSNVEKQKDSSLRNSLSFISKKLSKENFKVKGGDVKEDAGKKYVEFTVSKDNVKAGPFYLYIDDNALKLEISDEAKNSLTKFNPEDSKLMKAELITTEDDIKDYHADVQKSLDRRNDYLNKVELKLDSFINGLTSLEITMLKRLLVKKYRKIS